MSVQNINAASVAASIGNSTKLRDSSAMSEKVAPPFLRRNLEDSALPSLQRAGSMNGVSRNYSVLEKAAISDLIRAVRDIRNGDIPEAKDRLISMSKSGFNELCNKRNVDPLMLGELSTAMDISKDPKKVLPAVFEVLKYGGASELSSKLRPASEARA